MTDPFQVDDPDFNAASFAEGLLKFASQQRDQLAKSHKRSREMLWHRIEDGWDADRVQAVLDALGPRGPVMFQATFLLGALAEIGRVSKSKPEIFGEAAAALQAALAPYIASGDIDAADLAAPMTYTVDETGTIKLDAGQEYPGSPDDEEETA